MNARRGAALVLAIVIALAPRSSDANEAPVPATPVPRGASAGEDASAPTLVAALTETIPTPTGPATRSLARLHASVPIVMAAGTVVGGVGGAGGDRAYGSRATGSLRLGVAPRLAVEARTALMIRDRGEAFQRRSVQNGARLLRHGPSTGVWAGVAFEHSLAGDRLPATPLFGLGAWTAPGRVALAFSLEQTIQRARFSSVVRQEPLIDTLEALFITVFDDRLVRATSGLMSGRWERGRVGVETVAGITVSRFTSPRRWMQTAFEVAVRPRLTLFATVGQSTPRWLALDAGLSRKASLGFKLTSAANAASAAAAERRDRGPEFRLRRLGEGWYVVQVRVAAGSVEVMGDFSAWEPLALRHVNGERWAVAVKLEPGVHQIQVRVNGGAWSPPAGLPTAADGFIGDVGVFVAE